MPAPFGSEARLRIFEAQPSGCAERIFPGKPSPWDLSGRFPVRPSVLRANRGVGRAPHARKGRHCANPNVFSFRPPAFRAPARNHDMPWFELGRSLRTRRAHPSEKTAFRVISGLFPQGHPSLEGPPGGAGSARPEGWHKLDRGMSPLSPRLPPTCRSLCHTRACTRPCNAGAETAPLRENRLSRHLRPFPARPSQLGWPSPRRGGLRTPVKRARA